MVALLPGRMTRSETGIGSPGCTMTSRTEGSSFSGSKSSKLAIRASFGTAIVTGASGRACASPRPKASSAGRREAAGKRREAEGAPAGALGDGPHAALEQARVAAELVDDEACDRRGVLRLERRLRPENLREDAAAVDVGDKHDRTAGGASEAHVSDVALAQIDLGRAARAFDEHEIGLALEVRKTVEHRAHQLRLERLIFSRASGADDAALDHDLRADLALRLQEHGIHMDARRNPAGQRLQGLRPPDLAAVVGDRGVVRHVLRLERPHGKSPPRIGAAETGDDQRLADVRARALEHQRPGGQNSMPSWARTPAAK